MKISIITVVRNNQDTIRDAIESVLNQTYKDIEYIIIDGASTDKTLEIINEYKDKISKIISEPDRGIYDAMNKGLALASGEVVGILNSDDFYINNLVIQKIADEIDWTAPCVICIANNFNKFDLHAVNQMQRNIKLVKYKKYDDLILFEHLNAPDFIIKNEKNLTETANLSSDDSFEMRYQKVSQNLKNLCCDIENYIESLGDDVSRHQTKYYIAFKKVKNIVCMELFQKYIILTLKLDPKNVELEADFIRDISNVGHHGTGDVEVKIRNDEDFEKSKELIDRAYNEN